MHSSLESALACGTPAVAGKPGLEGLFYIHRLIRESQTFFFAGGFSIATILFWPGVAAGLGNRFLSDADSVFLFAGDLKLNANLCFLRRVAHDAVQTGQSQ